MIITIIRHGKTKGNELKVYLGKTDEGLSKIGIDEITQNFNKSIYPKVDYIYTSPMKRCIDTMKIIYHNSDYSVVNELMECDFGDFEYKNYDELKNNKNYKKWLDSNGNIAFPNGENKKDFIERSIGAFENIVLDSTNFKHNSIAIICHGGTIMSIMESFDISKQNFYKWQVKNGYGYIIELDEKTWQNQKIFKSVMIK